MQETLFPLLEPHQTGYLRVDDVHEIYWEESGNPQGVPIVFLHGGPGAGAKPTHRCFFDPNFYRIIIFDQRGAGRSKPFGEMRQNTTPLLISDMEQLRQYLNIDKWMIFGGSWGSTLAIAYAESHPDKCLGLILRGIFLCRPQEIDWFLYGVRTIFPDAWRAFSSFIPAEERQDLLTAYTKRVMHPDPAIHLPAVKAFSGYEGRISCLLPKEEVIDDFEDYSVALGLARAECHYFSNGIFLENNQLLKNIKRLHSIPGIIIQGRYDIVCPIVTADEVAAAWPQAEYIVVPDAGHAASEQSLQRELVKATERFKEILR
jgi:proline iminopeptidase